MRFGTSFFDWTVFKKTVFRFWPLWGVYLAGWFIALPLNGLAMRRLYGFMESFALYRVPRSVTADGMLVFVIFGALAAMAVFSHLYNPRSANFFGSLPIRREGLFLTYYLAGLAFLIVPNAVIFLLTLAVEAAGGYVSWTGLLFWLAVACGEGFFFYTLAVFCAMFTGHSLALPAFFAIVNGFVSVMTMLLTTVFESFFYGFAGFPNWVGTAVLWLTPTMKLYAAVDCQTVFVSEEVNNSAYSNLRQELEVHGLDVVGIYALAALALAVCAFLLYRARRLESAGDVVAVSRMRPVFRYGVALCAGLALGMSTTAIIGGGDTALMVSIAVWGIIGYFAAEMLLQKSFKVFGKWKGAAAVAAVFAALFLVVGFDLTGFETRVPDPDNVERVEVSGISSVRWLGDSGDYRDMVLTGQERIRDIITLHRAAVEQRDGGMLYGSDRTWLNITYHLKGGGTMSRSYNLRFNPGLVEREGSAAWAFQRIFDDRELSWRLYGFDELEDCLARGGRLDQAVYEKYGSYRDDIIGEAVFYGGDAEALFAAVKEDFFAGRIGVRQVSQAGNIAPNEYLSFNTYEYGQDGSYRQYFVKIAIHGDASNTRAALEDLERVAVDPGPPDPDYPDTVMK